MTTLREFIGHVKGGLAKSSHFSISFNSPKSVSSGLFGSGEMRKILIYCESASLPGMNIMTAPTRTFGESREVPSERMFDPAQFTFYVDRQMKTKLFFDEWINSIQNTRSRTFNFYENYITDITVTVYDSMDIPQYEVTLYEAFPKTLQQIELNYNSRDIMRTNVTFAYKYWRTTAMTTSGSGDSVRVPTSAYNVQSIIPTALFQIF